MLSSLLLDLIIIIIILLAYNVGPVAKMVGQHYANIINRRLSYKRHVSTLPAVFPANISIHYKLDFRLVARMRPTRQPS